jgi:hypothetical protein
MEKGIISRVLRFGLLPLIVSVIAMSVVFVTVFLVTYGAYWLYVNIMK